MGSEKATVISSRVRLARNIKNSKMPVAMSIEDARVVEETVRAAMQDRRDFEYYRVEELDPLERRKLVESRIISKELISKPKISSFFLNKDNSITVMLNEEDQIRIQSLVKGLDLNSAWDKAEEIDDFLASQLEYAFDDDFGYLTACPTNTGTGLRASVMIHLPFLTAGGHIDRLADSIRKIGITIRGLYGEGSKPIGSIYQISNQTTLGESEKDIIRKIEAIVKHVIEKEDEAMDIFLQRRRIELEDRVYRSYGILKNARLLSVKESMELLSDIRVGVNLGLIDFDIEKINELTISTQAANVQRLAGDEDSEQKRNIKRAEIFRENFS